MVDGISPSSDSGDRPSISPAQIVTIRPQAETMTRQKLPYFVGISGATAGTPGLSMNLVIIPPNGTAAAHYHKDYETAIFILKGKIETRYGKGLKQSMINTAGDFLFIPPGVPHQPTNLTDEPAQAIVARNDPNEQENVVMYDPAQDL
ncbi:MAG: cupin domain-containing protein [Synechococcales cyanobacterium T60_A2020_003]|nr:cupin domain-containing protein [Synechococcales cyanobacterium T60_A2020_003]